MPEVRHGLPAYYLIAPAEASSNLARYDGVRYGLRVDGAGRRGDELRHPCGRFRGRGEATDHARHVRTVVGLLRRLLRPGTEGAARSSCGPSSSAYQHVDVLLGATTPTTAFELGAKTGDPLAMYLSDLFTVPSNLAGHPGGERALRAVSATGCRSACRSSLPALGEPVMFQVAAALEACPLAWWIGPSGGGTPRSRVGVTQASARDPEAAFEPVIGLEVHCELRTETKLFCGCRNAVRPGTEHQHVPGLSRAARFAAGAERSVPSSTRCGSARLFTARSATAGSTGRTTSIRTCRRTTRSRSTPSPINVAGYLELADGSRVGIVRAHIEEDTGKTTHVGGGGRIHDADYSLVDYNRAGVPLVEIVSEPDITQRRAGPPLCRGAPRSARRVGSVGRPHGRGLDARSTPTCRCAGRVRRARDPLRDKEPQLSPVSGPGDRVRDPAADRDDLARAGRWCSRPATGTRRAEVTVALRSKEEAFDYRYFSEPDLVPVDPDATWLQEVAAAPRPDARRAGARGCSTEALGARPPPPPRRIRS